MKITVEFSDAELKQTRRITGERKNSAAVRKLVLDALMMHRRRETAAKFTSGEWGVQLEGYEAARAADRAAAAHRANAFRR